MGILRYCQKRPTAIRNVPACTAVRCADRPILRLRNFGMKAPIKRPSVNRTNPAFPKASVTSDIAPESPLIIKYVLLLAPLQKAEHNANHNDICKAVPSGEAIPSKTDQSLPPIPIHADSFRSGRANFKSKPIPQRVVYCNLRNLQPRIR